jgi:hypothetical protein
MGQSGVGGHHRRAVPGLGRPISFAAVAEVAQQGYHLSPDPRAGIDFDLQNVDRGGGERTAIRPASSSRFRCWKA